MLTCCYLKSCASKLRSLIVSNGPGISITSFNFYAPSAQSKGTRKFWFFLNFNSPHPEEHTSNTPPQHRPQKPLSNFMEFTKGTRVLVRFFLLGRGPPPTWQYHPGIGSQASHCILTPIPLFNGRRPTNPVPDPHQVGLTAFESSQVNRDA